MTGANRIAFVGAGRWQRGCSEPASSRGLGVPALDGDAAAPGIRLADRSVIVDIRRPELVVAGVEALDLPLGGAIAACNEAGMAGAAALRARFDLPGARPEVVRRMTDKAEQRAAWDSAGVAGPRWRLSTAPVDASVFEALGRPVVVKPTDSAGSRGVSVVRDAAELGVAWQRAHAASRAGRVIVESWLPGVEHTVETFSEAGRCHVLAITSKRKVPGTSATVASELATPSHPATLTARIGDTVARALQALGYDEGPGHTEVMVDDDGEVRLVEAAGRGGGFMVFDGLVEAASGFDIRRATLLQALGRPVTVPSIAARAVVLRFVPSRPGTVRALRGLDPVSPGVRCGGIASVGDRVGRAAADGDRLAWILATGATPAEATARADEAEARIEIEVEP